MKMNRLLILLLMVIFLSGSCTLYKDLDDIEHVNPYDPETENSTPVSAYDYNIIKYINIDEIELEWQTSIDNDFAYYQIELSIDPGFNNIILNAKIYSKEQTSYSIHRDGNTALNPKTVYYLRFTVSDKGGLNKSTELKIRTLPIVSDFIPVYHPALSSGDFQILDYTYDSTSERHFIAAKVGDDYNIYMINNSETPLQLASGAANLIYSTSQTNITGLNSNKFKPTSVEVVDNNLFLYAQQTGLWKSSDISSLVPVSEVTPSSITNSITNKPSMLDSGAGSFVRKIDDNSILYITGLFNFGYYPSPYTSFNGLMDGFGPAAEHQLTMSAYDITKTPDDQYVICTGAVGFGKFRLTSYSYPVGGWQKIWVKNLGIGTDNGQFLMAGNVAVDNQGFIWISDILKNQVQIFDSNGTFVSLISEGVIGGKRVKGVRKINCSGEKIAVFYNNVIEFYQTQ